MEAVVAGMPSDGQLLEAFPGADIPRARAVIADALAGAVAGSYAHLRAHETVLDFVCRLLLLKTK